MQRSDATLHVHQVLAALELLEQVPIGSVLAVSQRVEDPVPLEHGGDFIQGSTEIGVGLGAVHRGSLPSAMISALFDCMQHGLFTAAAAGLESPARHRCRNG